MKSYFFPSPKLLIISVSSNLPQQFRQDLETHQDFVLFFTMSFLRLLAFNAPIKVFQSLVFICCHLHASSCLNKDLKTALRG